MKDEDVQRDPDLVSLRNGLEEGLSVVHHTGADREATARLLELYAEAVREGYEKPSACADSGGKRPTASGMSVMVESVSELSAHFEETLFQAEQDGLDRHEVADLLERLADEVRKGYTELPEHRGPWWHDVHGGNLEGDDADQ